jgi:excinuclease ABC subunit C
MPRTVIVGPYLAERAELLEAALSERRGSAVEVRVAERGDKRRLRELAERNAKLALDQDRLRREHRRQRRVESLASLRDALGMADLPVRIEGFDISNIGGEHTVASMVVFEGGATKKADYRRFRVRGETGEGRGDGPDDFASMEEILGRRMNRYLEQVDLSPHDSKRAARADHDRRRQGSARGGDAGAEALRRSRRHRDQPRQARGGSLRAGPLSANRPRRRLRGIEAAAARPR